MSQARNYGALRRGKPNRGRPTPKLVVDCHSDRGSGAEDTERRTKRWGSGALAGSSVGTLAGSSAGALRLLAVSTPYGLEALATDDCGRRGLCGGPLYKPLARLRRRRDIWARPRASSSQRGNLAVVRCQHINISISDRGTGGLCPTSVAERPYVPAVVSHTTPKSIVRQCSTMRTRRVE